MYIIFGDSKHDYRPMSYVVGIFETKEYANYITPTEKKNENLKYYIKSFETNKIYGENYTYDK